MTNNNNDNDIEYVSAESKAKFLELFNIELTDDITITMLEKALSKGFTLTICPNYQDCLSYKYYSIIDGMAGDECLSRKEALLSLLFKNSYFYADKIYYAITDSMLTI